MRSKLIFWIFVGVSIAHLFTQALDLTEFSRFTKPALMPLLLYYVYESSKGKVTMRILLLCLAVFLSWLGDLAMMYSDQQVYFLIGIGLFLSAHIVYIVVLNKSSYQPLKFDVLRVLPFALYAVAFFKFLIPSSGDFATPVFVYGIVICVMAATARLREGGTSQQSYLLALFGGILFLISDSVLAIDRFYGTIPIVGVWVMSTYIAAQLLLVKGILNHAD